MKTKVLLAIAVLSYVPVAVGGNGAVYPSEKLAEFVVAKLDVTSLPTAYRPKKQNGKKTLTDYGYTVQKLDETEALVEETAGTRKLSIKILQASPTGIYTCMAQANRDSHAPEAQSVILLKRKGSNALLKGRETWREFKSCPVIGESDGGSPAYGGD